ncbi:MAG: flagellar motor switch protein FliM [Armatimonadetes bacterium]|nr:MAG: flagellar motor switch protein FliM [Armatimonadota bacterium]
MADNLSPEEIEALLGSLAGAEADDGGGLEAELAASSVQERATALSGPKASVVEGKRVERYDFRRSDKLNKDQLRTLTMLHDNAARLMSGSLAGYLRTPVHVELVSVEQVPYEEYLRSITQSVFAILSLSPLNGQSLLEAETGLVFSMLDRMLGGPGRSAERKNLSDLERPLVTQIVDRILACVKQSWESILLLNPVVEALETNPQFVQIATANDVAVTILFEVKMGQSRGAMSLCIPYLILKPVASKLTMQKWAATAGRRKSEAARRTLASHLRHAGVECTFELGTATLTVRELISLKPGDVVRLDQRTTDGLKMLVGGRPKYLCNLLSGKRLQFSVTGPLRR